MQIYKGHILFTKTPDKFDIIERGYIVVENGKIREVCATLPEALRTAEVVDFGDKLIIPAMNDLHVHAPQYRNMGMAMDMELLPWLDNYTFPEEAKYADVDYADKMYRRFVKHLWKVGTMRTVAFGTVHKASTIRLMELFEQAGMGAMVGKVNMNRNCPDALCETVPDAVAADEETYQHMERPRRVGSHNINTAFCAELHARNADRNWPSGTQIQYACAVAFVRKQRRNSVGQGVGTRIDLLWRCLSSLWLVRADAHTDGTLLLYGRRRTRIDEKKQGIRSALPTVELRFRKRYGTHSHLLAKRHSGGARLRHQRRTSLVDVPSDGLCCRNFETPLCTER